MTAARQERKSRRRYTALSGGIVAAAAALALLVPLVAASGQPGGAVRPVTVGRVVANFYTGLAIDGFDPVAYFVDDAPKPGRAELEVRSGGGIWRFRNEGNRAAFSADPEVYMPRFGGYDPVAVARGVATPGNPRLWAVTQKRLYLFYSEEAQAAFAKDPDAAIEAAERHWPEVSRKLTP